jgi:hypothetical protein
MARPAAANFFTPMLVRRGLTATPARRCATPLTVSRRFGALPKSPHREMLSKNSDQEIAIAYFFWAKTANSLGEHPPAATLVR